MLAGSMKTTDLATKAAKEYWADLSCHYCAMAKIKPLPVVRYNPTTGDFVCMFHRLQIANHWMAYREWQEKYFKHD